MYYKKKFPAFIIACELIILISISINHVSAFSFHKWGITEKELTINHIPKNIKHKSYKAVQLKNYKNKIMDYVLAIDAKLKKKISILRVFSSPERDYLFVKDRLYSVLENYGTISNDSHEKILFILSESYGTPSLQKDKDLTIHSFTTEKTKVLVFSKIQSNGIKCKVYHYNSNLFRSLIMK